MSMEALATALLKTLEAGNLNAAPSTLNQGSALGQIENLEEVMVMVTLDEDALKLQKGMNKTSKKTSLVQFKRQLSPGRLGGSAQFEGAVGRRQDSDFTNVVVPMAYYSEIREVTVQASIFNTFDGVSAEDRYAKDAALRLASDIEFDLFRGKADFSNAGVFDGNMAVIPAMPNILGADAQIRMADGQRNAKDLFFNAHGASASGVIAVGGPLLQGYVEDAYVRSVMQHGKADKLFLDPITAAAYNKITIGKERIMLAGAPQESVGASLMKQYVAGGGMVELESSRFLSGRTGPEESNSDAPGTPSIATAVVAGTATIAAGTYQYYVTAVNELGESNASASASAVVAALGDQVTVTITAPGSGTVRYYNVYRSNAGGSAASAAFIGRVMTAGASTPFLDLGNKKPGFVTGFLLQKDSMEIVEAAPYSRIKLAQVQLTIPEAHFRFCTLAVKKPRVNVILDNLTGSSGNPA